MSPREAPQVDPAQRLALLTTYKALENAGIVPDATPSTQRDRVRVFIDSTSNDWGETNGAQDVDTYYISGSCRAFIPGKQNYSFESSGPSYSVDTACSSSLAAMHIACNALWRGDIDTAISGGTNVMTNPDITAGLDRGHFLGVTFHAPKIPVICPLLGEVVSSAGTFGPSYLGREAVHFVGSIEAAKAGAPREGVSWAEIGPHPVVAGFLKTNIGAITVLPTLQLNKDTCGGL